MNGFIRSNRTVVSAPLNGKIGTLRRICSNRFMVNEPHNGTIRTNGLIRARCTSQKRDQFVEFRNNHKFYIKFTNVVQIII